MRSLLACATLIAMSGTALADYRLTILHTNDFHSRIEPINKYDSTCSAEDSEAGACFGGSARLVTAIRDRRRASDNTILVDGGDQFQGSLFYTYYMGQAAAELMNALGYDAMTVGNHEFDDGPEVLRGFMDAIGFPILLANADIDAEPELAGVLEPSTVIERAGERIGLIGIAPADTAELSSPGPNITFSDPVEALKEEVQALTGQGVNKIILLSHSGYGVDQRIAAEVEGIDVIVGGHSNTLLSNTQEGAAGPYPTMVKSPSGTDVPIVQAYAYGKFLGQLDVTFDDAGNVTAARGEPMLVDASIAEDEAIAARIDELAQPLDEIRNKVIGRAESPIDGSREACRARECAMGVLVTDAMLDRVSDQGVDIAITNGGGLRASIDAGDITMGEVLTVLPFQNTLSTFELKGADIVAALENGVSQVEEGGGRFPQVAGLRYEWSPSGTAGENRIRSVEIMQDGAWQPIDPQATYGVVSNDFMRGGGDGYTLFAEKAMDAYDFGPPLDEVVADYIADQGGSVNPEPEGRITEVQ